MSYIKKISIVFIALIGFINSAPADNFFKTSDEFSSKARSAILLDYNTGDILYEKDAKNKYPPSSMSKLMTLYMVFDALKNKGLSIKQNIEITPSIDKKSKEMIKKGGSTMYLQAGQSIPLEELLNGIIVASSNEACVAIAEYLNGSEAEFSVKMNEKAKEIGMYNSHFVNASGWPDPDHKMSAEDIAILSKRIISDFPKMYEKFKIKTYYFRDIKAPFINRNRLLWLDRHVDGLKTGHTRIGGFGLVASKKKDGRRLVGVINGLKLRGSSFENNNKRAKELKRLMDWGYKRFDNYQIFSPTDTVAEIPTWFGNKSKVKVGVKDGLIITLPRIFDKRRISLKMHYKSPIQVPVKKFEKIGDLEVYIDNREYKTVDTVALEDINRINFFLKVFENISQIILRLIGS